MNFTIYLLDHGFPCRFPDVCIYCGKPEESTITYRTRLEESDEEKTILTSINLQLPYCNKHAGIAKRNRLIDRLLCGIAITTGIIVLIWELIHISQHGLFGISEEKLLIVITLLTISIVNVFGAYVLYHILKGISFLIVPIITRHPFRFPIGLSIYTYKITGIIHLEFKNEQVAEKFKEINDIYFKSNLAFNNKTS